MAPIDSLAAAAVLVFVVSLGLLAHELSHALALRAAGVPHEIEWFAGVTRGSPLRTWLTGTWAVVRPQPSPTTPPWLLRASAMMPLTMVVPLSLVALGVMPDPFLSGGLHVKVAVIGWTACALPSPQDFAVLWYAERAIDESVTSRTARSR